MGGDAREDVCPRCGHAFRAETGALGRLGAVLGRKPARVQCGEPTDHGWACTCRSRFHIGLTPVG